jgi:hypothetical protein
MYAYITHINSYYMKNVWINVQCQYLHANTNIYLCAYSSLRGNSVHHLWTDYYPHPHPKKKLTIFIQEIASILA